MAKGISSLRSLSDRRVQLIQRTEQCRPALRDQWRQTRHAVGQIVGGGKAGLPLDPGQMGGQFGQIEIARRPARLMRGAGQCGQITVAQGGGDAVLAVGQAVQKHPRQQRRLRWPQIGHQPAQGHPLWQMIVQGRCQRLG